MSPGNRPKRNGSLAPANRKIPAAAITSPKISKPLPSSRAGSIAHSRADFTPFGVIPSESERLSAKGDEESASAVDFLFYT
jgi:hypothetical protein